MKLIRSVEVEKFRSCDSVELSRLGDVTVLVGVNNSGKSNILRALHLFFNDETDTGTFLNFDVDYHIGPPSKKKKSIRVSVEFDLPDKFSFRKDLKGAQELLGSQFWIRKTWTLDSFEPAIEIRRPGGSYRAVVRLRSFASNHVGYYDNWPGAC